MKPTITRAEELQLIGLLALARQHNARLEDIKAAVLALLEVTPSLDPLGDAADHVSDAVYSDFDAATLLDGLGVELTD
jgi:hypothetical protein